MMQSQDSLLSAPNLLLSRLSFMFSFYLPPYYSLSLSLGQNVSLSCLGLTAWSAPVRWKRTIKWSQTRQSTASGPYEPRQTTGYCTFCQFFNPQQHIGDDFDMLRSKKTLEEEIPFWVQGTRCDSVGLKQQIAQSLGQWKSGLQCFLTSTSAAM